VLVRSLTRAYDRAFDPSALTRPTRVGLPAALMRRMLTLDLATPVPTLVRDSAIVMFMFLFGCRTPTAVGLRDSDITVTDARVVAVLVHRKG
jgi:site-specific recombinase XerC